MLRVGRMVGQLFSLSIMKANAGARGRVFRYYALVPHAYRFTPSRGSEATWATTGLKAAENNR